MLVPALSRPTHTNVVLGPGPGQSFTSNNSHALCDNVHFSWYQNVVHTQANLSTSRVQYLKHLSREVTNFRRDHIWICTWYLDVARY